MISTTKNVIILGDSNVGKTSLKQRLFHDTFSHYSPTTIGVDFEEGYIHRDWTASSKQPRIRFNWWDTGGHARYRSLLSNYYSNITTLIIVVDMSDVLTFPSAEKWLQEFCIINGPQRKNVAELYLVGNKCDKTQYVSVEQCQQFAKKFHMTFFDVSCSTGHNIAHLAHSLNQPPRPFSALKVNTQTQYFEMDEDNNDNGRGVQRHTENRRVLQILRPRDSRPRMSRCCQIL